MLLVRTSIGPSPIHDIGLFAAEPIAKGTVVWRFTPGVDARLTLAQVEALPPAAREHYIFYWFTSKQPGLRVLCVDNAKHFNHSDTPNTKSAHEDGEEEVVTRALRDILPGEEITDDYRNYESEFRGW